MKHAFRRRRQSRFTALLQGLTLPLLLFIAVPVQSAVVMGPERILTSPASGPLPDNTILSGASPLWTGTDWMLVWSDPRLSGRTVGQRLEPAGTVRFNPCPLLPPGASGSLVPMGGSYLLAGSGGLFLLDHDFSIPVRISSTLTSAASDGFDALAWNDDLDELARIHNGSTIHLDPARVTVGSSVLRRPAAAAGNGLFLIAWPRYGTPYRPDEIAFNLVDASGTARLDQPGVIGPLESTVGLASIAVSFDGEHFIVAWISDDGEVLTARIDENGNVGSIQTADRWGNSGALGLIQLVTTGPGESLLTWSIRDESSIGDRATIGVRLNRGQPDGDAFRFAPGSVLIGSDGAGGLAAFSLTTGRVRLDEWNPSFEPDGEWIDVQRGTPDRMGLVLQSDSPLVLWRNWPSEGATLTIGKAAGTGGYLERVDDLGLTGYGYDLAVGSSSILAVWSGLIYEPHIPTRLPILAQRFAPDGSRIGEAVELGQGMSPRAIALADGWLVTWIDQDTNLLELVKLGPEGLPDWDPRPVAGVVVAGDRISEQQVHPSLISVPGDRALLVWQEGDFQYTCVVTCPLPPAPGVIRTALVDAEGVDEESIRTLDGPRARALPVAAAGPDGILLTWFEQRSYEHTPADLEGILLSPEGSPASEIFPIAAVDQVYTYSSEQEISAIAPVGRRFLMAWTAWRSAPQEFVLEGAVIDTTDPDSPSASKFTLAAPAPFSSRIRLRAEDSRSVLLFADRPVDDPDWGGSWQIISHRITLDPTRKRGVRPGP